MDLMIDLREYLMGKSMLLFQLMYKVLLTELIH